MIMGLQNEEGTIQTETRKMVDIASNFAINNSRKSHK